MPSGDKSVPSAIRERCRALFFDAIPTLAEIAGNPNERTSARIDAIRALGEFGLGRADAGAVHLHAEGGAMLGVVMLPALGSGRDPEQAANEARTPLALLSKVEGSDG